MEPLKRARVNIINQYDDRKRRKTSVTTTESITAFEDLSNELIYEIFDFLHRHHAFQSFYDLNKRFQNLFIHSNLPIQINISSISKSIFHRYFTQMILPHTNRIQSLRIATPFAAEMCLSLSPIISHLYRLETLIINDIESDYIEEVLNHLSSLPVLSSLVIKSIGIVRISVDIYRKIFRLPALKYYQMSVETKYCGCPLPIATNEFSPIEHLIINNEVLSNELDTLLSYVPQLRRLSLGHLTGYRDHSVRRNSITLNYLKVVSLELHETSFNDFELLVRDLFHQIQSLRFTTASPYYSTRGMEHVNANRWQQLISTSMPNLQIFDFQHIYRLWRSSIDRQVCQSEINNFNSLYWIEHQWFFEHQHYKTKYVNIAVLCSTNPYKRKSYMLVGEPAHIDHQIYNIESVRQVSIGNRDAMEQFGSRFANTNELTLTEDFEITCDSIVTSLNRIIPLRQLVQLTLECHRLPFEQFIELLYFTSNIHTLTFHSAIRYRTDSISIEQNTLFQLVSNNNTVINLTVNKEITLEGVQLLIVLFPRLESLTMNFNEEALEPIIRFLLSNLNGNTRHLSSLCISKRGRVLIEKLRTLIESGQLLRDYTLKQIVQKLYLWW